MTISSCAIAQEAEMSKVTVAPEVATATYRVPTGDVGWPSLRLTATCPKFFIIKL